MKLKIISNNTYIETLINETLSNDTNLDLNNSVIPSFNYMFNDFKEYEISTYTITDNSILKDIGYAVNNWLLFGYAAVQQNIIWQITEKLAQSKSTKASHDI